MPSFRPATVLLLSALCVCQDLPPGIVLPVMLDSRINARKDDCGKQLRGKIMQAVPLPFGGNIEKGSVISGHILSVTRPRSSGSRIAVEFDSIQSGKRAIAVRVALLALASTGRTWLDGSSTLVRLTPNPAAGCPRGAGYEREQATWIFSGAACGTYQLGRLRIASPGTNPPIGEIRLASTGNIDIHGRSAWLLITIPDAEGERSKLNQGDNPALIP